MEATRIGCVKYLNTLPLINGLERCPDVRLHAAVPSKLAPMLLAGEVDIALASLVDYARDAGTLALVPVGMIGCDGQTLTVRIFSRVPMEQVTTLHADTDSHTSVILAQLVLRQRFGRKVEVIDYDAREHVAVGASAGEPQTILVIGDKAVTDEPSAKDFPHQLDLGQAWHDWTGLPFVYATWMCRASEVASERIERVSELLERQRLRNAIRLDWIASTHAPARRWPVELARTYLRDYLRFDLDARARAGAERFLREAASAGLLPACSVRWHDGAPAGA